MGRLNITCLATLQGGIRGAMVARLTPDQKVACSIHVGFNFEQDGIFVFVQRSFTLGRV